MRQRILPFCFFVVFLWACGKGKDVTPEYDEYPFGNNAFTAVQVNGSTIITLQQDTMNRIIRKTKGDPQTIGESGGILANGGGELVIGVKKPLTISLNGGGVRNIDSVSMQQLTIAGQSGTVNLQRIFVENGINVTITNIGDWYIAGKTPYLSVATSNFGRFFGFDLVADSCSVYHGGISDVQVNVRQKLTGSVTSIGNLFYKGNPPVLNVSTNPNGGKAIHQQ